MHLPNWLYQVAADGFQTTEWECLNVLELQQQVRRAGPGKAKLVVPVPLKRKPPRWNPDR